MYHGSILMVDTHLFRPESESSRPVAGPRPSAGGFVARCVRWLLAPIDFPGKWPNDAAPTERYNKDEGNGMNYYRGPTDR